MRLKKHDRGTNSDRHCSQRANLQRHVDSSGFKEIHHEPVESLGFLSVANMSDSIDQVNNLREIQALRRLAGHPNIIKLHEVPQSVASPARRAAGGWLVTFADWVVKV